MASWLRAAPIVVLTARPYLTQVIIELEAKDWYATLIIASLIKQ